MWQCTDSVVYQPTGSMVYEREINIPLHSSKEYSTLYLFTPKWIPSPISGKSTQNFLKILLRKTEIKNNQLQAYHNLLHCRRIDAKWKPKSRNRMMYFYTALPAGINTHSNKLIIIWHLFCSSWFSVQYCLCCSDVLNSHCGRKRCSTGLVPDCKVQSWVG